MRARIMISVLFCGVPQLLKFESHTDSITDVNGISGQNRKSIRQDPTFFIRGDSSDLRNINSAGDVRSIALRHVEHVQY